MSEDEEQLELYRSHEGTIRVGGNTAVHPAAARAWHCFDEGTPAIEFLFMGANAGHNAMKIMNLFMQMVERNTQGEVAVSFQPVRFITIVNNEKLKDDDSIRQCVVWRTVVHQKLEIIPNDNDTEEEKGSAPSTPAA